MMSVPSYLWVSLSFRVPHPHQLLRLSETLAMCSAPELHGGKVDCFFLTLTMAGLAWSPGQGASRSASLPGVEHPGVCELQQVLAPQLRPQKPVLTVSSG